MVHTIVARGKLKPRRGVKLGPCVCVRLLRCSCTARAPSDNVHSTMLHVFPTRKNATRDRPHHGHVGVVLDQVADDDHLRLEVVGPHVSDLDHSPVRRAVFLGSCCCGSHFFTRSRQGWSTTQHDPRALKRIPILRIGKRRVANQRRGLLVYGRQSIHLWWRGGYVHLQPACVLLLWIG